MNKNISFYPALIFTLIFFINLRSQTSLVPDFQVNNNKGINGARQVNPSLAMDGSGNFIITWRDSRGSHSQYAWDTYSRRFSSEGIPEGNDFKIHLDNLSAYSSTSIAVDTSGNYLIALKANIDGKESIYIQKYNSSGFTIGDPIDAIDNLEIERLNAIAISLNGKGAFTIVWKDYRNNPSYSDVYGQRFSNESIKLGTNFKINDDLQITSYGTPDISMLEDNGFVVTWVESRNIIGDSDVFAQIYSKEGNKIGDNFKVNDDTLNANQARTAIATDGYSGFIITWRDQRIDSRNPSIFAQRFLRDGTRIERNFKVNDDTDPKGSDSPAISMNTEGKFVISWSGRSESDYDTYAKLYSNEGNALTETFLVNDDSQNAEQSHSSVLISEEGDFIVTWTDPRNGNEDIFGQRYLASGTPSGNNFKVNTDSATSQSSANLSVFSDGDFIITWIDGRNGNDYDIYGQQFSSDGRKFKDNFKVNDDLNNTRQFYPSTSALGENKFIVIWSDERGDDNKIYGQLYNRDGQKINNNFSISGNKDIYATMPSLSADSVGNFAVVWESYPNIYLQEFTINGVKVDSVIALTDNDLSHPSQASINPVTNKFYVVAWVDFRNGSGPKNLEFDNLDDHEPFNADIYGQLVSLTGDTIGNNFRINDDDGVQHQYRPVVASDKNGNFVVAWVDYRKWPGKVYAQLFYPDGTRHGNNFRVGTNADTTSQTNIAISMSSDGKFMITWKDYRNQPGKIYGQRFLPDGSPIGPDFLISDIVSAHQSFPDVAILNNKIYNAWNDNRTGDTGTDIWANVLEWDKPVGIRKNSNNIPIKFHLAQNFPNPFNPQTTIRYKLEEANDVSLIIYDITGKKFKTLVNHFQKAGEYSIRFDASNFASGVYIYKLKSGVFEESRKMILMR
jgi:large repetitive protein